MKIKFFLLLFPILLFSSTFIEKISPFSVDKSVKLFTETIKSKGMSIFAIVDHQKAAKSVGLDIDKSILIIFGNPKIHTRMMLKDEKVALDLPFKVLIYKNVDGKTVILYKNPQFLKQNYNLKNCMAIDSMEKFLDVITDKITKEKR